ncbi:hypothetical protein AB0C51_02565 [Streptomyces pathocidini]|uniref:hypothetical protein n=1 Tax=Streptomyces pathocidini TaxID=1650571 RepID=UPI00340A5AF6
MEAELATLAATGATTLVSLMVSDSWAGAKAGLARFFARGGEEAAAAGELDACRAELVTALDAGEEAFAEDVAAEWRLRLRRLLRSDPAAVDELRSLMAELDPEGAAEPGGGAVHNSISGGTVNGPVVQGRDFHGPTFHLPKEQR